MKPSMLSVEGLKTAVSRLPDDALSATRAVALANLDEHGLPTVRHEDWKYTDLRPAIDISNRWLADGALGPTAGDISATIASATRSIDADWLVIANGTIDMSYFNSSRGIEVERFSESAAPFVMDRPLADLNAALLQDGLRVRVHAATEKPLGLLIIDNAHSGAAVSQANVEIMVAPGCDVEIIEYQTSSGRGDHYANSVVTMDIGEAARTGYVRIQERRIGHVQTGRLSVTVGKDARFAMASYDLGGGLVRNDVDIDLGATGADLVCNGLYLAGDGQHIDNHIRIDHRVGPATSSQEFRGILNGRCRCVWNGKAIVHKGADGTDAKQANHNLLLSEHAEINAKPELEIYADDVKCSHGTTVGQLDEAALFYLRSRGLGKHEAIQVLTRAFAADLVGRAPVNAAKTLIAARVDARLAELTLEPTS
ncbi:MAG: Fe-S cluster assembly protein SufD [Gammaproteobacteria bacterium]|nr:Fe-S cluster assembly protein SufD [Gammaproteobacteria bacterium]